MRGNKLNPPESLILAYTGMSSFTDCCSFDCASDLSGGEPVWTGLQYSDWNNLHSSLGPDASVLGPG